MCTAISFKTKDHYFGRNLDLEYSLGEQIVITPRNYEMTFRNLPILKSHFAIIGVAKIDNDYPLYYDATNEAGLSVAALNFPENAHYFTPKEGFYNIASFEMINYILGNYKNISQVKSFLNNANIIDIRYSKEYPNTHLHWIIADSNSTITVESTKKGLNIYENTLGILTNSPAFPLQCFNLNNYAHLSADNPEKTFSENLKFKSYSRGLGGLGLPGDFSSMSRFVRGAFSKLLSVCDEDELSSIGQFFHILSYVEQIKDV